MNIEEKAREYVNETFAGSSAWDRDRLVKDWLSKERKTKGLIADFEKRVGNIKGKRLLEIGFGSGIQLLVFGREGAEVHGLEVDELLYKIGGEILAETDADIRMYDGKTFPYKDDYFDYCLATSVLEHVSDVPAVLAEAYRTLKPGGRFYVSFPNRWWPKETHTGVYFLSFLPRNIASWFLKKACKRDAVDEWNLHFLSASQLKKMLKENAIPFRIILERESPYPVRSFFKKALAFFGIHHSVLLSTIMLVLEKPLHETKAL